MCGDRMCVRINLKLEWFTSLIWRVFFMQSLKYHVLYYKSNTKLSFMKTLPLPFCPCNMIISLQSKLKDFMRCPECVKWELFVYVSLLCRCWCQMVALVPGRQLCGWWSRSLMKMTISPYFLRKSTRSNCQRGKGGRRGSPFIVCSRMTAMMGPIVTFRTALWMAMRMGSSSLTPRLQWCHHARPSLLGAMIYWLYGSFLVLFNLCSKLLRFSKFLDYYSEVQHLNWVTTHKIFVVICVRYQVWYKSNCVMNVFWIVALHQERRKDILSTCPSDWFIDVGWSSITLWNFALKYLTLSEFYRSVSLFARTLNWPSVDGWHTAIQDYHFQ